VGSEGRVRALRGATSVEIDDREAILEATEQLLGEMLRRNDVELDDLVSIVFTATSDLTSAFPALAARRLGITEVPLLCAAEIAVPDAMPRCVRVLMHLYTHLDSASLRHVYLRDAQDLRADLFH
jgi:chorismate mutase